MQQTIVGWLIKDVGLQRTSRITVLFSVEAAICIPVVSDTNRMTPLSSVCIQARQRPLLVKASSCQGGYAPPSLGVRVALWVTHALDIGTMSALMLVMHVEKE